MNQGNFRIKLILILLTLLVSASLCAQVLVTGKVVDAQGEGMSLALITVLNKSTTAITDSTGVFSIKLDIGKNTLRISYLSYNTKETEIIVKKEMRPIVIKMTPSVSTINEVKVYGASNRTRVLETTMGVNRFNIDEIKRMPVLLGEVDLIKSIQMLPGVQSTSEASSSFSVRGGSPDQNLILLDNSAIYNPSHLMGFFSSFNSDVISNVTLYKGNLPLKYGGRVSSLLDVNTITPQPEKPSFTAGIGLIASKLTFQTPLGGKTSLIVGGRRSYADLFLKLSPDKAIRNSVFYFYDMNLKLIHRISENDNISINAYNGKDRFEVEDIGMNYGNTVGSVSWRHYYSSDVMSNFTLFATSYKYKVYSNIDNIEMRVKSALNDIGGNADFSYKINDKNSLSFGAMVSNHTFKPGSLTSPQIYSLDLGKELSMEAAAYIANNQNIGKILTLSYGLRLNGFENGGYTNLDPRISAVIKIGEGASIKTSYSRNTQYMQWASNSSSGSAVDFWFPSSDKIKPQLSDMVSLGYFKTFGGDAFLFTAECYYKLIRNVVDFADNTNLILNEKIENAVRAGNGKSYGIEFMIEKKSGSLTGFVNYTYSRSKLTIEDINKGKTYNSPYDTPNALNVFLNYQISPKWNISANWTYSTGRPASFPSGKFEYNGEFFPIYTGRNEYRRRDYHRLDFSATYNEHWNFSIYNAYGRKNAWTIDFAPEGASMIYLFSVVPSVTYNFKF